MVFARRLDQISAEQRADLDKRDELAGAMFKQALTLNPTSETHQFSGGKLDS